MIGLRKFKAPNMGSNKDFSSEIDNEGGRFRWSENIFEGSIIYFELVSLKFSNNKTFIMSILLCSLLKTLSLRYP